MSKLSGALWRWDGKRKDSLQLRLWNLNICIEKVDAKCWLAEMTLVMTLLPLAHVFQCLFTFALVSASRRLAEIWRLSRRGATGELEVEFKFQMRSCKLSFLFPPHRQSAPESLIAGFTESFVILQRVFVRCDRFVQRTYWTTSSCFYESRAKLTIENRTSGLILL